MTDAICRCPPGVRRDRSFGGQCPVVARRLEFGSGDHMILNECRVVEDRVAESFELLSLGRRCRPDETSVEAPYFAPVSSAARSTMRWSTAGGDNSDARDIPASINFRRRISETGCPVPWPSTASVMHRSVVGQRQRPSPRQSTGNPSRYERMGCFWTTSLACHHFPNPRERPALAQMSPRRTTNSITWLSTNGLLSGQIAIAR